MRSHERIPIHDHSDLDSGGFVAASTTVRVTGSETVTTSVAFGSPVAVGTALDDGALGVAARADHVHTNAYLGTVLVSGTAASGYALLATGAGTAAWQANSASVIWYDEGNLAGTAGIVNIVGSGGTVAVSGGTATITVSGGTASGGGGSVVFYDEGTVAGTAAILNVVGNGGTVAVSGGTATLTLQNMLPPVTQAIGGYQNSSSTNVVNLAAAPTGALVAFISGTSRGGTAISQTNVTWTQRYTGNGNSQYAEVWTGAITGAAGTAVTAQFASATRSEFVVVELNQAALTAVGTAVTSTSAGAVQLTSGFLTSPAVGDLCVYIHAAAGPNSSIGGLNVPYYSYDFAGGQGCSALFYHRGAASFATRLLSSSVAYFTAMMKIS